MARCDEGLGFQLGGMVWEPLGITNFTFSPSPKWRWASQPKFDVKMAPMDHNNPTFFCHPIIPIACTLLQQVSQGMSTHSTLGLLH
jgi:hypothetical protein